jgi:glycosyltransferase A (GT-A) superfamily protein (DUF2064 family)
MAKSPRPGHVKTRLCPPCSLSQAAAIAAAALADTLDAVRACGARRRIIALDGPAGDWLPGDFDVIPQQGHTFGERLQTAWSAAGGPGIQIGMDTPQVTPQLIDDALVRLLKPEVDAVLGLALDGGWWAIGFRRVPRDAFRGVPMSTTGTGVAQLQRLRSLGLRVAMLPTLRDLDTIDDAASLAPQLTGRTGPVLAELFSSVGS